MTGFLDRVRYGYEQQGPARFALLLLGTIVILAAIAIYFTVNEPNRILHALTAVVTTLWSAERFLERPKPDRLWGAVLAVGAAALWAQVFGLIPYPLDWGTLS
jgi:hypothetical protein